jgi:hypothetical protein
MIKITGLINTKSYYYWRRRRNPASESQWTCHGGYEDRDRDGNDRCWRWVQEYTTRSPTTTTAAAATATTGFYFFFFNYYEYKQGTDG